MPDLKKMLTLEALSEALPSWLKRSTKPEYNADEIDSTLTTNQFVTASDKDNWNAKGTYSKPSGGIPKSDLSSIVQTSLEKADSALQSETDPTVPSWAKQTNKPSYTQDEVADGSTYKRVTQTEKDTWSGKQNALSTTQMQAVNSGINSTKVAQIETNKTNILYGLQTGVKNWFDVAAEGSSQYGLSTYSADTETGTVNVVSTASTGSWARYRVPVTLPAGTYTISGNVTNIVGGLDITGNTSVDDRGTVIISRISRSSTGNFSSDFTINSETSFYVAFYANYSGTAQNRSATVTHMMICPKSIYDQDSSYQPPSLPNYDLTRLESEDRAALAEEIDAGAKNKFNPANIVELRNLATNGSDYAYVSTVTDTRTQCNFCVFSWNGNTKIDQLTKVDVTANGKIALIFTKTANYNKISFGHSGQSKDLMIFYNVSDLVNGQTYVLSTNVTQFNPSVTNFAFSDVMLCTKAAFGVSQKFVPYRPSYDDLIAQSTYTTSTSSTSVTNLLYKAANTLGKSPTNINFFVVSVYSDASDCLVICGAYKHGTIGYGVSMASRNITFEGTVNNLGTVGWTGGTAPYHVQVRFF